MFLIDKKNYTKGFTLIELLVVIAIIGLLASIIFVSLGKARARARDAKRLSDMHNIELALEMHFNNHGHYPSISPDSCCDGWDQGPCGNDPFIGALVSEKLFSKTPVDPKPGSSGNSCYGYAYYRYPAGCCGCDPKKGAFYVLGIRNMETNNGPYPTSPGWKCPNRNWQSEFEWVTGKFEDKQ